MKILVTGAAGYIGSTLCARLLQRGYEVCGLDSFAYHQWSLAHLTSNSRFSLVRMDIRNTNELRKLCQGFDFVIPLAGIVGAPACKRDPDSAKAINLDAQVQMLQGLSPAQGVLMPTTNSAYGTTPQGMVTDESSPLNPLTDYAIHKVQVEKVLMDRQNAASFRLATVFGASPRMRLDLLVNDFTFRALKDRYLVLFEAKFRRNYLHVEDVADLFIHGLENFDRVKGQIFNAGLSNANLTKWELCELIQKQIPDFFFTEALLAKDPDKRDYEVSNRKIESTGWKARVSIEEGIRELIKAYQMLAGDRFSNVH